MSLHDLGFWLLITLSPLVLGVIGRQLMRNARAADREKIEQIIQPLVKELRAHMAEEAVHAAQVDLTLAEIKGQFAVNNTEHADFERRLDHLEGRP